MPRYHLTKRPEPRPLTDPYQWGTRHAVTLYDVCVLPPRGSALARGYALTPPAPDAETLTLEADRYAERRVLSLPPGVTLEVTPIVVGGSDIPLELLDRQFRPMDWLLACGASA